MCEVDTWFEGIGLHISDLEEFCTQEGFDHLYRDISWSNLTLSSPFSCFYDNHEGHYIVVSPNLCNTVGYDETAFKDICGYTAEELAEMLFEQLAKDYFSLEAFMASEKLDTLSEVEFKQAFIEIISDYIGYRDLHYQDFDQIVHTYQCW